MSANRDHVQILIDALIFGPFEQCIGMLYRGVKVPSHGLREARCAVGLANFVAWANGCNVDRIIKEGDSYRQELFAGPSGKTTTMPFEIRDWYGFNGSDVLRLVDLNDLRLYSFPRIGACLRELYMKD